MKRLLITGFAPFGGDRINPSWQAVSALPETVGGWELVKRELPVTFRGAPQTLFEAMDETEPDAVLMIGLAGSRGAVTPERQGFNEIVARIPDNEGNQPHDEPVFADGPDAYFASLPVKAMVEAIRAAGIPASLSNTAGTFICNHVLYGVRYLAEHEFPGLKSGFIHIPFLPEQTVDKPGVPSMSLEDTVKGITAAVAAAVK